ncbi:hypothetical protein CVS35_21900 [Pectobacterium atrosepticum]|nr:hypothetical protein CVS35_21900 [Pectobacterium atrosepticum]
MCLTFFYCDNHHALILPSQQSAIGMKCGGKEYLGPRLKLGKCQNIPVILQVTCTLAAFTHPNHLPE